MLTSRDRLYALVAQVPDGPVQDRLSVMTERAEAAVRSAWDIASQAQRAAQLVDTLDRDKVEGLLKEARRRLAALPGGDPFSDAEVGRLEAEAALLADQYASLNQLANTVEDAGEQLRLLDLRLDAVVARAAQMALRPSGFEELAAVEGQLDDALGELDALRSGLAAVDVLGAVSWQR